ncbi:hypothetical protein EDB81DRAFT_672252, partial [Dactylonectria macrodidyma]
LFTFCIPYMFNPDEGDLGGKTGFVFTALSAITWLISFFKLLEIKNRTYL